MALCIWDWAKMDPAVVVQSETVEGDEYGRVGRSENLQSSCRTAEPRETRRMLLVVRKAHSRDSVPCWDNIGQCTGIFACH